MAVAVAPVTGSMLVTFEYDTTGLAWCILHDNVVLAWIVDETGPAAPRPSILGSFPAPPPATAPIASPGWAVREGTVLFIPNVARGSAAALFTFMATNNGASRRLYSNFADPALYNEWQRWSIENPQLVLKEPPQ